jgi:hypothetical protein
MIGTKKALVTDDIQMIAAHLMGPDSVRIAPSISLGLLDKDSYIGRVVARGNYLYIPLIQGRQCRLRVIDLLTNREVHTLEIEALRPRPDSWLDGTDGESITACLTGAHLYLASPRALTTVFLGNPAKPVISSRTAVRELTERLYGYERKLFSQGHRLYELSFLEPVRFHSLRDPGRPLPMGYAKYISVADIGRSSVGDGSVVVADTDFYMLWRNGILQYRATQRGFETIRYLDPGEDGLDRLAVGGGYLYAAGYDDTLNVEHIDVFKIRQ